MLLWEKRRFVHSCNQKAFYYCTLSRLQKRIRQRRISRSCLLDVHISAWRKLYAGGSDATLITFTGLNHKIFDVLLQKFDPLFQKHTPHTTDGIIRERRIMTGMKRKISSMDYLALSLAWTRTLGSMYTLQIIFGLTSMYVRFGRRLLVQVLRKETKEATRNPI